MIIRTFLFDIDGVVIQGKPGSGPHWASTLEQDLSISYAALQQEFFRPHWEDVVCGREGLIDTLASVLDRLSPGLAAERLVQYWFENDAQIDSVLLDVFRQLRAAGHAVQLASNQEHRRATYLMETLGLGRHVDGLHYSAELGCRKPSAEFFGKVQDRLGIPASDVILVDDDAANIEGAGRCGWQVLHWDTQRVRHPDLVAALLDLAG